MSKYCKKAITIIAGKQTYQNLATFDDINDLNDTVRKHKELHQLNKNQTRVLDLLHRYSAKYKGVSFLTKNNIANQLDISRRTVIRACNHLESLNIIKQYETKRKSDMQQTSNAIVIQPIDTQVSDKNDEKCHTKKTTTDLMIIALKMYHLCNSFYQSLRRIVPLIAGQCTTELNTSCILNVHASVTLSIQEVFYVSIS